MHLMKILPGNNSFNLVIKSSSRLNNLIKRTIVVKVKANETNNPAITRCSINHAKSWVAL